MKINWYVILIASIWFSSAIGELSTKDGSSMCVALTATVLIGIGYLILREVL